MLALEGVFSSQAYLFFMFAGLMFLDMVSFSKPIWSIPTILLYSCLISQGLLELLWTVYSEGKLQSCLKLRNFQNPFNKDKSVHTTYSWNIMCQKWEGDCGLWVLIEII